MEKKYKPIWNLTLPFLRKGKMKDFVVHTEGVVRAMELLLEKNPADKNILIPAAILHDVGWSEVPKKLQKSKAKKDREKALHAHLKLAPPIIEEVLAKVRYDPQKINKIIEIVNAHKFENPTEIEKQLLIDADTMSDSFKEQFYSDVKEYKTTPEKLYQFRKQNRFYTKTAKKLFKTEIEKRKKEFKKMKNEEVN
ncbi:MAG: HD domain-containing protein [Candidatus Diapherotrites archaeon]